MKPNACNHPRRRGPVQGARGERRNILAPPGGKRVTSIVTRSGIESISLEDGERLRPDQGHPHRPRRLAMKGVP